MTDIIKVENEIEEITNALISLENDIKAYKELTDKYEAMKKKLYDAMTSRGIDNLRMANGTLLSRVAEVKEEKAVVPVFDEDKFKKDFATLYDEYCNNEEKVIKRRRAGYVRITLKKEKDDE